MSTLLTVLGVSLLIILHEAGHYLVARACGMRVLRFSVGFGPALLHFRRGETTWQIAAIPLGGYVQIEGMGPSEEGEPRNDPRSYKNKPLWQRGLVILAGPLTNWLLAALFIAALGASVGFRQYDESKAIIGEVMAQGAASAAGMVAGDEILTAGGQEVNDWASLVKIVQAHPARDLNLSVMRGTQRLELRVTPKRSGDVGVIGVLPDSELHRFGPMGAIGAGVRGAWSLTQRQVSLLWGLLMGTQEGRLAGLPGIVKTIAQEAERGADRLLTQLAWLSIGLCLLNLIPIPALDGGRLLFLGIEGVLRRPVNERLEGMVHAVGFVLLLGLMIFVSVRDVL